MSAASRCVKSVWAISSAIRASSVSTPVEYFRLRAIRGFSHLITIPFVTDKRTFVVVGANLAGGRAVETLIQEGFEGRIILVGDEPDRPYERPPLSKELLRGEETAHFLRDEAF